MHCIRSLKPRILLLILALLGHGLCANSGTTAALQKRVVVVVGSTGSNAVQAVLEAAGVWMHPDKDSTHNSNLYLRKVLQPITTGLQANHTCFKQSAPDWSKNKAPEHMFQRVMPADLIPNITEWHKEVRWVISICTGSSTNSQHDRGSESSSTSHNNSSCGQNMFQRVIPGDLMTNITEWHKQMAAEMAAAVPSNATTWGWKHPYALFTLNPIYQAFPSVHVIHQVQDGRDYAINNLLKHKKRTTNPFEQHFVMMLTGKNFTEQQLGTLDYSAAVGAAWSLANHRALKWAGNRATGMRGTHSVVRLEDLCDAHSARAAVRAMLQNAQLPHDDAIVQQAVQRLGNSKCHAGYWQVALNNARPHVAAAMLTIDASMAAGLEAFDYAPKSNPSLPDWLVAKPIMTSLTAAAKAAAGPSNHPIILTFVSNGYERVISNWLAWLQHSGVDTSRVLIVAREQCFKAVRAIARGTNATVFSLPVLRPGEETGLDENGRKADAFRNVRAGIWLERVRTMHQLIQNGIPVLLTDLDAIWTHNPLPYIASAAKEQAQGYDMIVSKGYFPSEVYKNLKVAACMGFMFLNSTRPAQSFIHSLLREKLRQLDLDAVRYFNDQQHMNQALVDADLAYNVTLDNKDLAHKPDTVITARKVTTAPSSMRVLFMPESMVQRTCHGRSAINRDALVVHCQSPKSGPEKEKFLKELGWWKQLPKPSQVAHGGLKGTQPSRLGKPVSTAL